MCSSIIYKESILPLLLTNSKVFIYDGTSEIEKTINEIFNKKIQLKDNEFITKFAIDTKYLYSPYCHIKKTKSDKIDYPVLTTTALIDNNNLKIAFSGLCSFPFRNTQIEDILNNSCLNRENKLNKVIQNLPDTPMDNIDGSKEYRKFVLKNTVNKVLDCFNL